MKYPKSQQAFVLAFAPACFALLALGCWHAKPSEPTSLAVSSPGGDIAVEILVANELTYSVTWHGRTLVAPSPISMILEGGTIVGPSAQVVDSQRHSVDEEITPVVPEKFATIRDHYEELSLDFAAGWGLDIRAYDDGFAYRFRSGVCDYSVVAAEEFTATFAGNPLVWFPTEESFLTHSERVYWQVGLNEIPADSMASLPVLVVFPDGPKVAITEADLRDYPGMYVTGSSANALTGIWPAYPTAVEQTNDRTVEVTERGEFLARTSGDRTFPWRVFVIAESDGDLIESTMVYRLASPLRIDDPSWIRPGKVAWDWWNALNLEGVEFEAGVNTATYRHNDQRAGEPVPPGVRPADEHGDTSAPTRHVRGVREPATDVVRLAVELPA